MASCPADSHPSSASFLSSEWGPASKGAPVVPTSRCPVHVLIKPSSPALACGARRSWQKRQARLAGAGRRGAGGPSCSLGCLLWEGPAEAALWGARGQTRGPHRPPAPAPRAGDLAPRPRTPDEPRGAAALTDVWTAVSSEVLRQIALPGLFLKPPATDPARQRDAVVLKTLDLDLSHRADDGHHAAWYRDAERG